MGARGETDRFAPAPRWLVDGLAGLVVTIVGGAGLSLGWAGVSAALSPVAIGGPETGLRFASVGWYLVAVGSFLGLYFGWGLGLTVAYRRYRDLAPASLLERPDAEAVRWLVGTGALAVVLVVGVTVGWWAASRGSTDPLRVPVLLVGTLATPSPMYEGLGRLVGAVIPGLVGAAVPGLVLGAAGGIVVGALVHGVFQASLARSAPRWVAIGLPALALPVLFGETADPVALVVLVAYAGAVGLAYDRTRTLLVPMAAYAVLNVAALAATLLLLRWVATGG